MVQFFFNVPLGLLLSSAALVIAAVGVWIWMWREAKRLRSQLQALQQAWARIAPPSLEERPWGLDSRKFAEIQKAGKHLADTRAGEWWRAVDEALDCYVSPEEREGWFLTTRLREVLPESLIGRHFHSAFFNAVPGLLTGLGLTLTFVAILIALAPVKYNDQDPAAPVTGIQGLINGLSGKFISSIVALILSVIFTVSERFTLRGLRRAYDEMIETGRSLFPYLSPSHILLDLQRFASKQTVSISHISSEVVDRFVSAFQTEVTPAIAEGVTSGMAEKLQEEFRPTMQRMNDSLEQLREAIVGLESQKQESIAAEIRGLLDSLESSLIRALGELGAQFHEALAGAANQEFGNVRGTLETTRQMLSEMNAQFASMQAAFAGVIERAEQSTNIQLDTGRQQSETLARLMEGLMLKLQETADNNISSIRSQLTLVVADLAEKVGGLSQELMAASHQAMSDSQASARQVLEETSNWSEASARRLEGLLSAIEARSAEFQSEGAALLELQRSLQATIDGNARVLSAIADASREVKTYSTALAGQAGTLENLNKYQAQITSNLKETAVSIDTAFQRHQDLLNRYGQVFDNYAAVFRGLDDTIGSVLDTVQTGIQKYSQSVEHNFQEIVKAANQLLPDIVRKLDAQTGEIAEQIEELSDVLGKGLERLNGRTR